MRICYIGDAGAIHTQRWVDWFAERHEVSVISTTLDPGLERYRVANLPTHLPSGSRLLGSLLRIRHLLRELRPDVLHCHYINEAGWLGAASRWRPLVITAWGSDVYRAPRESMAARRLNPWATRAADAVTCDSIDQARLIRSWGVPADRVSVIGWGVDRDHFHPGVSGSAMRARLGIPAAAPVVLSPRQWYSNSNIPAVIASHARLPEDTHLLLKRIPGYEPDGGAAVFNAIDSSPARERIHVLGAIPPDELPAMYGAADVVVSLCTTDGTSVSVLEAMAVGRPVVALYNPSLAEWIGEPGGRLVQSLEPDAVAQALVELLAPEAQERASDHNRDVIASRADRALEFSRMDELYGRLVGTASPAGAPRS